MAFSAGEIEAVLRLRDEMSAKLREASGVLAKFGGDAQTTTAKLSAFGSSATAAGTALSVGITAPILAAAGASLYFSGQFESTMVKLQTLAGVSSGDLVKVKDHILDLAPAVGIGPQALALAMTKISSTVADTTVALEILDISAKGSAAGLGEAVDVAGALTSVLNSYGASNITAARAGDILTQAIKDGGAEAKELAPTLANVVPFAAAMGISFEEVAANIATMTKLGVPATEAVTSLTSVMTAMNKPSKEGEEALAKMGQTFGMLRQEIKDKGLAATLIDLQTRFAGNSEELIKIFGRVEGFKNILGTAASQAETYTQVVKNMGESSKGAGVLQEAFNEITKTQQHSLSSLTAQVQRIAIRFGDALAPSLAKVTEMAKPLLENILGLAEGFGKLDPTTQKIIIGTVALVAAIGPVLLILGQLASGLAAVIAIAPAVGAAVTFMTGPFGLFALAAAAVIAIILKFRGDLKILENSSTDAAKGLEHIGEAGKKLHDNFKEAVESNKALAEVTGGTTAVIGLGARALLQFGDASEESQRKVKGLTKEVELEALITEEAKNAIEEHRKAVSKLTEEFKGNAEGTKVIQDAFIALTQSGKELSGEVSARLIPKLNELRESGVTLTQSQNDAYAAGVRHKDGLIAQGVAVLEAGKVTLQMIDAQKDLGRTEDEIAQQFHVTKETLKSYENGLKDAEKITQDLAKATEQADLAIAASGEDTLAKRLSQLKIKREAEIAANTLSLGDTQNARNKAIQINRQYDALEGNEKLAASKKFDELLTAAKDTTRTAEATRNMSDLQKQLYMVRENAAQQIAVIEKNKDLTIAEKKALSDEVLRLEKIKAAGIDGTEKYVREHSKAHYDELIAIAKKHYDALRVAGSDATKEAIDAAKKEVEAAQKAGGQASVNWSEGFKGIVSKVPGIVADAFKSGAGISGALKGILSVAGAGVGKMVGDTISNSLKSLGQFAGPIGEAIGSLAGPIIQGFIKLFDHTTKDLKRIASSYGVTASDEIAAAIKASMKSLNLSQVAATVFNATKLFPTVNTSNINEALRLTHDAFSMIETRQLSVAQAGKVVDEMFAKMSAAGTSATGLISKGLLEIIELNDRFGTNSASISKYVTSETTKAVGGLTTFLSVGAKAYDTLAEKEKALGDLKQKASDTETQYADKRNKLNKDDKDYKEKLAELLKEELAERAKITNEMDALSQGIEKQKLIIEATAISSQAAATAMSGAIVASFVELQKQGMSVTEALKAVQPAIKAMETQLIASGLSGGNAFIGLQKMAKLAGDEIAGPALDAVGGLNEAMKGLHNAGLMDQEMFTGLSGQISSTFNTLVAQGHDGNTAMMLMQPSLQTIWELQKDFGYAVDEGTQLLLDQAVAAGVVGGKHQDVQKQVLDVLERIAKVLGADLPAASRAAETQAATSAQRIEQELNAIEVERIDIQAVAEVHWDYDTFAVPDVTVDAPDGAMLGGLVTQDGIQRLSHGGMVRGYARGTDTVPAMLTPGEAVLTTRAVGTLGTSAISRLNNGGSMSNDDVISELRLLRKQQAASDRQLPLLVALSVRDAMQLNR